MKILSSNFFVFCVLVALAFVLFENGINGDFVFDDRSVIVGHPLVEDISGVFKAFLYPYHYDRPQSGLYRPITSASYTLNWHLFSGQPYGFHLVNILLHAVISFLIFLIIVGLKDRRTAIVSSLIFLFLPIHVEAVTSIVGRAEMLMLLFFIGAFYSVQRNHYKTASLCFFLSLLSKETGIVFIPVFIFFELVWKKTSAKELFKRTLYFLPPIIIYPLLRYNALGANYFLNNEAYTFFNPILAMDFFPGLWTAFKVLYLYVQKIIFPTYFSSDYSYNQIIAVNNLFNSWQAMTGIVILGMSIYLSTLRRSSLIGLGAFIFLCSYLIVSNLFIKIGTIMAERLMYMPSLGFILIVSGYISRIMKNTKGIFVATKMPFVFGALFIGWLAIYGFQIVKGNTLWKSEKTLFGNAYKYTPNSVVNITNMASILFREGKNTEALEKIETALGIEPKNSPTLHLAGQIYKKMGEDKTAEEFWLKAIRVQPDYLYPYLSLGTLYYQKGDFKSGEMVLLKAKEIYNTPNVISLLALNKIGLEKYSEAIILIEEKSGSKPREYELRFILGVGYLKSGQELRARELLLDLKDPTITEDSFFKNLKNTRIFNIEI